jgi:hypothetical protein
LNFDLSLTTRRGHDERMADADNTFDASFMRGRSRDPERIDELLEQIRVSCHQYPDLRLLQLLICVIDHRPNPLFNVEDLVLSERLREFAETGRFPSAS